MRQTIRQKLRGLVPEALKNKARKFVWMRLNPSWRLNSGVTVRVLNYNDWMIYNDIFVEGEYDAAINHFAGRNEPIRQRLRTSLIWAEMSASSPCGWPIFS